MFYLHGGGYAIGSAADSVSLASDVARRVGARAISVDYRLAPEHRFPAAVDDAVAAYRALLESGTPSSGIAFVGESAGGGLAAATLVALKHADLPQPACAAVFSPWAGGTHVFQSFSAVLDEAGAALDAAAAFVRRAWESAQQE